MKPTQIKKTLVIALKLGLIAAIFGFLIWKAVAATDADGKNVFETLWGQPKRYDLIAAAFLVQFFAASVTFLRWGLLARALGLVLPMKDAFRLGFLGIMLNLAPMGIVGGDAVKAYLLAQKNPEKRPEAVASVIVDRIVGLLVMFLCGAVFVLSTRFAFRGEIRARLFSQLVFALAIIGFGGVAVMFVPPFSLLFSKGHVERLAERIPLCGPMLGKLIRSLLLYRNRKIRLIQTFFITFLVHIPYGISLLLIAKGLFGRTNRMQADAASGAMRIGTPP